MRGREFLATADRLSRLQDESDWRSGISRAYYALYLECRESLRRWGFVIAPRSSHIDVSRRFSWPKNSDLNQIHLTFQSLSGLRNQADYDLSPILFFRNSVATINAIRETRFALSVLDAIEADPARLAQAIADIRAAFP